MQYLAEERTSQTTSDIGQCIIDWISQDSLTQIIQNFSIQLLLHSLASLFCTFKIGLY